MENQKFVVWTQFAAEIVNSKVSMIKAMKLESQ